MRLQEIVLPARKDRDSNASTSVHEGVGAKFTAAGAEGRGPLAFIPADVKFEVFEDVILELRWDVNDVEIGEIGRCWDALGEYAEVVGQDG